MSSYEKLVTQLNESSEILDEALENYRHRTIRRAVENGMCKESIAMVFELPIEIVESYVEIDPDTLPFLNKKL